MPILVYILFVKGILDISIVKPTWWIFIQFFKNSGPLHVSSILAHPQEALHKRHLVWCVCIMSVGCIRHFNPGAANWQHARTIPCAAATTLFPCCLIHLLSVMSFLVHSPASWKEPDILCRYASVVITEYYKVMVNSEELISTTEYLTL
jgi:hypothetical protein